MADGAPLAGHTLRCSSSSEAARTAAFLLTDLGANVLSVAPGQAADIADVDTAAGNRVALSAYGKRGRFRSAPTHHSAVEAVGGAQMGQYTYTPGLAYLVLHTRLSPRRCSRPRRPWHRCSDRPERRPASARCRACSQLIRASTSLVLSRSPVDSRTAHAAKLLFTRPTAQPMIGCSLAPRQRLS